MARALGAAAFACAALCAAAPARAGAGFGCHEGEDAERRNESRVQGLVALWENDKYSGRKLVYGTPSDRWYTNGVKLIAVGCAKARRPARDSGPMRAVTDFFLDAPQRQYGLVLGQLMFTPERIEVPAAQPDDRFWAGYAFVGSVAQLDRKERLDTIEFQLGVIGPPSLAEQAQKLVHERVGAPRPQGWDRQMKTEPTLNATYLGMRKGREVDLAGPLKWSVTPHYGLSFGSVQDYANAGATLRVGTRAGVLPAGTIDVPSLGGIGPLHNGVELFFRVDVRATAYNAFLDGGLLRGDPHPSTVKRRAFAYMLNRGITVELEKGLRATLSFNRRSREFDSPLASRGVHSFATLNLELRFDAP
jgi:hypothetical protein